MKRFPVVVFLFLLSSLVFGQTNRLPEILVPSEYAQAEANRLDAQVFKILPRGMFQGPFNAYKDEENPLGIREGGAYYSFTTGQHSYNKIPQIGLEQGNLKVGFYGANYGMIASLGRYSFSDVGLETPELAFLSTYKPPKLEKEIRAEAMSFHNNPVKGLLFSRNVPAILGNTYLLRAISFGEADVLVGFNVLQVDEDGSMTIIWKKLADFGKPIMLYVPDDELKASVDRIIAANGIQGLVVDVKDNTLIYRTFVSSAEMNRFSAALLENNIKYRRADYSQRSIPKK